MCLQVVLNFVTKIQIFDCKDCSCRSCLQIVPDFVIKIIQIFDCEDCSCQTCLQIVPEFVTKIIQIFDCKVARHGNMIVGKTGSGKSTAWRTLTRAMARLRKEDVQDERFQKVGALLGSNLIQCVGVINLCLLRRCSRVQWGV